MGGPARGGPRPGPASLREMEALMVEFDIALGWIRRMRAELDADVARQLDRRRLQLIPPASARAGP